MTPEFFKHSLRAFLRRRPFKPFFVEVISGDRFLVPHPEAIRQVADGLEFISPQRKYRLFDSSSIAQLLDIPDEGSV